MQPPLPPYAPLLDLVKSRPTPPPIPRSLYPCVEMNLQASSLDLDDDRILAAALSAPPVPPQARGQHKMVAAATPVKASSAAVTPVKKQPVKGANSAQKKSQRQQPPKSSQVAVSSAPSAADPKMSRKNVFSRAYHAAASDAKRRGVPELEVKALARRAGQEAASMCGQ